MLRWLLPSLTNYTACQLGLDSEHSGFINDPRLKGGPYPLPLSVECSWSKPVGCGSSVQGAAGPPVNYGTVWCGIPPSKWMQARHQPRDSGNGSRRRYWADASRRASTEMAAKGHPEGTERLRLVLLGQDLQASVNNSCTAPAGA